MYFDKPHTVDHHERRDELDAQPVYRDRAELGLTRETAITDRDDRRPVHRLGASSATGARDRHITRSLHGRRDLLDSQVTDRAGGHVLLARIEINLRPLIQALEQLLGGAAHEPEANRDPMLLHLDGRLELHALFEEPLGETGTNATLERSQRRVDSVLTSRGVECGQAIEQPCDREIAVSDSP